MEEGKQKERRHRRYLFTPFRRNRNRGQRSGIDGNVAYFYKDIASMTPEEVDQELKARFAQMKASGMIVCPIEILDEKDDTKPQAEVECITVNADMKNERRQNRFFIPRRKVG